MGFWSGRSSRQPPEKRDAWTGFPLASMAGMFGRTYQEVHPSVGETSLQCVAFGASCNLLAGMISELPLDVFSGSGANKRERPTPGYLDDPSGEGYGLEDWVYQYLISLFMRGNAFGRILDQGPTGMLRQVDILAPDRVGVYGDEEGEWHWTYNGREIPESRFLHRRSFPSPGALLGRSMIEQHADQLGLSITVTRFGRTWFQDGAHPSGMLVNSEVDMSDPDQSQTAKDRFLAAVFGNREPIVLGRGWDYKAIQIAPEESQFLETAGYTAAECARILGPGLAELMGYASGGSMTYTNVVDRDIALLKYTVGPWIRRVERILTQFLPQGQVAKLNRDALLETNALARWTVNKLRLDTGAAVINEIRDQEDQKPVEWGSEPFSMKAVAAPAEPQPERDPANAGGGGAQ